MAYGALATHVARYERAADGPLREDHLVGPLDTSDESAWRTETKRRALESGAEALLTKPIDFGTLRSEIDMRVERAA
jgi:hypothetical protein